MDSAHPVSPTMSKLNDLKQEKIAKIKECLSHNEVNLWQLRELCLTEGGLMTAELRRQSWPKLVAVDPNNGTALLDSTNAKEKVKKNQNEGEDSFTADTELIARDVGRAVYFRYPITEATRGLDLSDRNVDYIESGQSMLTKLIVSTISENGSGGRLNYYQGFHDVASVIFVNISRQPDLACGILHQIAQSHLRDAMMEDFSYMSALLEIVFYPLLQIFDEDLHDYMILREFGPTVFLTWMITLFSHDIHSEEIASRLFDAIIVSHPLMPLYLTIAILVQPKNRQKLVCAEYSEAAMLQVIASTLLTGIDHDFVSTHAGFSTQDIIECALGFMKRVPPKSLLNLVKYYDLGQSQILLKRCQSLCLFKEPKSWALTMTYNQSNDTVKLPSESEINDSISTLVPDEYPLAKVASGTSSISDNGGSPSRRAIRRITNMIQTSLGITSNMIPSR